MLSLLRDLLSRLGPSIENAIDLGRLIKEIALKWIKLNSTILENGLSDLINRLKATMVLKEHPRGIIETVFCNAIVTAHQIDINKYIVKGKFYHKDLPFSFRQAYFRLPVFEKHPSSGSRSKPEIEKLTLHQFNSINPQNFIKIGPRVSEL